MEYFLTFIYKSKILKMKLLIINTLRW